MDRSGRTDFSIQRLLNLPPQPVPVSVPVPDGSRLEAARPWAAAPVPVVPVLVPVVPVQCFGFCLPPPPPPEFCFCAHLDPNPAGGPDAALSGSQQPVPGAAQKVRMRTVFSSSQSRQLEALFRVTDYPAAEARSRLGRSAGLSDDTVRVWFKNRRARRKRSKVSSSCPSQRKSRSAAAAPQDGMELTPDP